MAASKWSTLMALGGVAERWYDAPSAQPMPRIIVDLPEKRTVVTAGRQTYLHAPFPFNDEWDLRHPRGQVGVVLSVDQTDGTVLGTIKDFVASVIASGSDSSLSRGESRQDVLTCCVDTDDEKLLLTRPFALLKPPLKADKFKLSAADVVTNPVFASSYLLSSISELSQRENIEASIAVFGGRGHNTPGTRVLATRFMECYAGLQDTATFQSLAQIGTTLISTLVMHACAQPDFTSTAQTALKMFGAMSASGSRGMGLSNMFAEVCLTNINKLCRSTAPVEWTGSSLYGDIVNITIPVVAYGQIVFVDVKTNQVRCTGGDSPILLVQDPVVVTVSSSKVRNNITCAEPVIEFAGAKAAIFRGCAPCSHCPDGTTCADCQPIVVGGNSFVTLSDMASAFPFVLLDEMNRQLLAACALPTSTTVVGAALKLVCTCSLTSTKCWYCAYGMFVNGSETTTNFMSVFGNGEEIRPLVLSTSAHVYREVVSQMCNMLINAVRLADERQHAKSSDLDSHQLPFPRDGRPPTKRKNGNGAAAAAAAPATTDDDASAANRKHRLPGYSTLEAADLDIHAIRPYLPPCLRRMVDDYATPGKRGHPNYHERCIMVSVLYNIEHLVEDGDDTKFMTVWRQLFVNHENEQQRKKCTGSEFRKIIDYNGVFFGYLEKGRIWGCRTAHDNGLCPFSKTRSDKIVVEDIEAADRRDTFDDCRVACAKKLPGTFMQSASIGRYFCEAINHHHQMK